MVKTSKLSVDHNFNDIVYSPIATNNTAKGKSAQIKEFTAGVSLKIIVVDGWLIDCSDDLLNNRFVCV